MFQVNEQYFGRIRHVFCVLPCSPTLIIILPPHAHNHWLWQLTKEKPERMHKLTTFCTKADISWNTRSSSLLSRSGSVDHGVDHSLDLSFTIFQPCFWLRKRLECDTCTFDRVLFVWLTLAVATIPFSWGGEGGGGGSAMSNTANWPLAVSGTKACQTISGLVKTRGHLTMLRHAIGWNLRVCLLWLTGVESSIACWTGSDQSLTESRPRTFQDRN